MVSISARFAANPWTAISRTCARTLLTVSSNLHGAYEHLEDPSEPELAGCVAASVTPRSKPRGAGERLGRGASIGNRTLVAPIVRGAGLEQRAASYRCSRELTTRMMRSCVAGS